MKVILEGLKMQSEVMEWPEGTAMGIKIALSQPVTVISDYNGKKVSEIPPINTIAEFEYTGKHYPLPDGQSAKIYVLSNIYKA